MKKRKINKNTKKYQNKQARIQYRKDLKEWSRLVKERDHNQCAICNKKEFLNSHHLLPKEQKDSKYKLDINNGITLCSLHHKYSYDLSAHKNPSKFYQWLITNKPNIWNWICNH